MSYDSFAAPQSAMQNPVLGMPDPPAFEPRAPSFRNGFASSPELSGRVANSVALPSIDEPIKPPLQRKQTTPGQMAAIPSPLSAMPNAKPQNQSMIDGFFNKAKKRAPGFVGSIIGGALGGPIGGLLGGALGGPIFNTVSENWGQPDALTQRVRDNYARFDATGEHPGTHRGGNGTISNQDFTRMSQENNRQRRSRGMSLDNQIKWG